jgi:putative mycofactocin binding protein MftB
MNTKKSYHLREGVQVREEKFRLLFYDYRGPRLYFVPTKNLIGNDFFNGSQSAEGLIESIHTRHRQSRRASQQWVMQVLTELAQKGLIHEQSIC